MKQKKNSLSCFDLVQAAFICFKVLGLIDWSWVKVFVPFYIWSILFFITLVAEETKR